MSLIFGDGEEELLAERDGIQIPGNRDAPILSPIRAISMSTVCIIPLASILNAACKSSDCETSKSRNLDSIAPSTQTRKSAPSMRSLTSKTRQRLHTLTSNSARTHETTSALTISAVIVGRSWDGSGCVSEESNKSRARSALQIFDASKFIASRLTVSLATAKRASGGPPLIR